MTARPYQSCPVCGRRTLVCNLKAHVGSVQCLALATRNGPLSPQAQRIVRLVGQLNQELDAPLTVNVEEFMRP